MSKTGTALLRYFIQNFRIFFQYNLLSGDRRMNRSKSAFSRTGLLHEQPRIEVEVHFKYPYVRSSSWLCMICKDVYAMQMKRKNMRFEFIYTFIQLRPRNSGNQHNPELFSIPYEPYLLLKSRLNTKTVHVVTLSNRLSLEWTNIYTCNLLLSQQTCSSTCSDKTSTNLHYLNNTTLILLYTHMIYPLTTGV